MDQAAPADRLVRDTHGIKTRGRSLEHRARWLVHPRALFGGSMPIIEVKALSKNFRAPLRKEGAGAAFAALWRREYREVNAVKSVSFSVEEGEAVAFLGPNGAGKSTTIKMLTGILTPSGGEVRVLGLNPSTERTKLAMGIGAVFGQKSQLWFHLPPADSFRLLGAIYELPRSIYETRRDALVERFGIGPYMNIPVRKLSLGERIRCEIAASLLHEPRVLFLDEPTIGLDVVVKKELRLLLAELRKRDGVTIFLTSHDIGDIEKICKRAIIIHHGALVLDEPMKELKHRAMARKHIGVKYAHPLDLSLLSVKPVKQTPDAASFLVDTRSHNLQALMTDLVRLGEIVDLTVEDEPLEDLIADIFRAKTEGDARGVSRRQTDEWTREESLIEKEGGAS